MKEQTIFKRYEIKYILSRAQYEAIMNDIVFHMIPDAHGHGHIQSLYFDTPSFLLARRSIEKPLYKEKLRVRSYGIASDDTDIFVEIKKKYEGVTYKRRICLSNRSATHFLQTNDLAHLPEASFNPQIASEICYFVNHYERICPAFLLQYERDAFYSKESPDFRVTFDNNITWRHDNLRLDDSFYGESLLPPDTVLMEVKTATAMPYWFVTLLSQNQINRTSYSKYGNAYITWRKNNDNFIK